MTRIKKNYEIKKRNLEIKKLFLNDSENIRGVNGKEEGKYKQNADNAKKSQQVTDSSVNAFIPESFFNSGFFSNSESFPDSALFPGIKIFENMPQTNIVKKQNKQQLTPQTLQTISGNILKNDVIKTFESINGEKSPLREEDKQNPFEILRYFMTHGNRFTFYYTRGLNNNLANFALIEEKKLEKPIEKAEQEKNNQISPFETSNLDLILKEFAKNENC